MFLYKEWEESGESAVQWVWEPVFEEGMIFFTSFHTRVSHQDLLLTNDWVLVKLSQNLKVSHSEYVLWMSHVYFHLAFQLNMCKVYQVKHTFLCFYND